MTEQEYKQFTVKLLKETLKYTDVSIENIINVKQFQTLFRE